MMPGAVSARIARNAVVGVLVTGLVFASAAAAAGSGTSLTVAQRTVSGKSTSVVVTGTARTVYELGGESLAKLKCLSAVCLKTWVPVTVSSATAKVTVAKGVPGTASVLHRVKAKLYQVMLDRHPLYTYAGDSNGSAKGQGIKSYGGSWHVVPAATATATAIER
jgi:predicted lipoprotein with Yx(FWY)xxD motif